MQSGGRTGYQEPVTGTAQWGLGASPASAVPTLGEVGRGTCRRASGDQRCKQQEKPRELCLACDEPSDVLEIIVNTLRRTFLESTQMPCRKAHEKLPFKKWGFLKKTPQPLHVGRAWPLPSRESGRRALLGDAGQHPSAREPAHTTVTPCGPDVRRPFSSVAFRPEPITQCNSHRNVTHPDGGTAPAPRLAPPELPGPPKPRDMRDSSAQRCLGRRDNRGRERTGKPRKAEQSVDFCSQQPGWFLSCDRPARGQDGPMMGNAGGVSLR